MKRSSLLMSLSFATLAVACGSQTGRAKVADAIDKPSAQISQTGTQTAISEDQTARTNASSAGAPAGLGFIIKKNPTLADGAMYASLAGDTNAANVLSTLDGIITRADEQTGGVDQTNPAAYFCTGAGKASIDALKQAGNGGGGSGGGCSASVSITPTCNADNTIFTMEWQASINCSGSSVEQLKNLNYTVNFSIKLGKSGTAVGAIYSGDVKYTYQSKEYHFAGGAGYMIDGDKSIGVGVFFFNDKSAVFYTGSENGSSAQPLGGSALCVKGGNGTFVIKCAKEGDDVHCALWKGDPLTLEGSSFTTAPETPTNLECNNSPLLKKLADFIKA